MARKTLKRKFEKVSYGLLIKLGDLDDEARVYSKPNEEFKAIKTEIGTIITDSLMSSFYKVVNYSEDSGTGVAMEITNKKIINRLKKEVNFAYQILEEKILISKGYCSGSNIDNCKDDDKQLRSEKQYGGGSIE